MFMPASLDVLHCFCNKSRGFIFPSQVAIYCIPDVLWLAPSFYLFSVVGIIPFFGFMFLNAA